MYGEETILVTGMGYYEDGYKVDNRCQACPYWHEDIEGDIACWKEEFETCEHHGISEIQ